MKNEYFFYLLLKKILFDLKNSILLFLSINNNLEIFLKYVR